MADIQTRLSRPLPVVEVKGDCQPETLGPIARELTTVLDTGVTAVALDLSQAKYSHLSSGFEPLWPVIQRMVRANSKLFIVGAIIGLINAAAKLPQHPFIFCKSLEEANQRLSTPEVEMRQEEFDGEEIG